MKIILEIIIQEFNKIYYVDNKTRDLIQMKICLVSNIYRYKKSHFEGLTMKQILKTLFDRGEHLTFLYNRVLGGKKTYHCPVKNELRKLSKKL